MGTAHRANLGLLLLGVLAIIPNHSHGDVRIVTEKRKLSEYVHHYEHLDYDASDVHDQHHRHKRSLRQDDHKVNIQFNSHGRDFELELKRDHSVFHNHLVVERGDNIANDVDLSHIYEGQLVDEPGSHCFGAIRGGVFDGQIHAKDGVYYVERANRYFKDDLLNKDFVDKKINNNSNSSTTSRTSKFHSVIYHENHLIDPFHHSKKVNIGHEHPGCGISDSVQSWMDQIQHNGEPSAILNATEEYDDNNIAEVPPLHFSNEAEQVGPAYKYSEQGNIRRKRSLPNPSPKKSCSLYIQTDPLFWLHIKDQEEEPAKIEEEILSLIAQHVKAVNRIYSDTSFDGKYKHNGYQFEVQRIKIHDDSKCHGLASRVQTHQPSKLSSLENEKTDANNPFCTPNVDVSNFLNLHSKTDHQEFCLAYVFTYRDFTGGTLGLAWVASASGASGGICETYKRYTENVNGVHHTAKRSLNTGIITFVNYNSPVPPKVSQLTLAHEIGHNFGSPHDYPSECRPGGKLGNYIMFASATSGDRDNNNKFSHCSKANISAVLDAIVDKRKDNCFVKSDGAFCGNKIVEDGEECDCGFDDQECQEQCCYPRQSSELNADENKQKRCTRRPGKECSPSEGPCCDKTCQFITNFDQVKCKSDGDCTEASYCNGKAAQCPEPDHKPDNVTECNQGTQVCQQGECKDSICVKYNHVSCFLTSEKVTDKRQLCELACKKPGLNSTCVSTRDLVAEGLISGLNEGLSLRPGSPCDNFQGYCDVFLKCRKVDAEGPLVRLKNLLFNQETLLTIVQWVTEFWWAVLLMGIAFVIFMAVFIKCFAIHTPSSNPRLPKNLHFTETLRRPVRSLQQKEEYDLDPATLNRMNFAYGIPTAPPLYLVEEAMEVERHYRPANGSSSSGAPPPYPGRGGPGHGYGEGRGHYNRASNHPAEFNQCQPQPRSSSDNSRGRNSSSGGGDRRSQNRHSRMEMQPIR